MNPWILTRSDLFITKLKIRSYQIKRTCTITICIDKWKWLILLIWLKLPLKIEIWEVKSPFIETHQFQLDADKGIQLYIREHPWILTVLSPVTIFTTKHNLNCFSSCPEYQIKYFSTWNAKSKQIFRLFYHKTRAETEAETAMHLNM